MNSNLRIATCVLIAGFGSSCLGITSDLSVSLHFNEGYGYVSSTDTQNLLGTTQTVAVDSVGRIVTCGTRSNGSGGREPIVHRFLPTGVADTSFNSGRGFVILREGLSGYDGTANASKYDTCKAVAIRSDSDSIYVLIISDATWARSVLVRVSESGSIDTSFGSSGYYITPSGTAMGGGVSWGDDLVSMVFTSDQKIVLAGSTLNTSERREPVVVRLSSTGVLDTSFGSGGYGFFGNNGNNPTGHAAASRNDYPYLLSQDSSGGLYWIGYCSEAAGGRDLCVIRYQSNGALDSSWGNLANGAFYYNAGGTNAAGGPAATKLATATGAKFDSNGKLLISTYLTGTAGTQQAAIFRLTAAGSVDSSFGTTASGVSVLNMNLTSLYGSYANAVKSEALAGLDIDSQGRIYASGWSATTAGGAGNNAYPLLFRFTSTGALDTSFGVAGYRMYERADGSTFRGGVASNGSKREVFTGLSIDRLGRILTTSRSPDSSSSYRLVVFRMLSNGDIND